jgi:hypothetical protein
LYSVEILPEKTEPVWAGNINLLKS